MKKQIIAVGGGGFSLQTEEPLIENYFLQQVRKKNPSVCFVPTATGDSDAYIVRFYEAFERVACRPCHLALFRPPRNLAEFVLSQDIIFVGGGNTRNMLALWREWNLDKIIRKAWRQGTVLGGVSAGSICWFEEGVTDSLPEKLTPMKCLGILKGSNCPHYDSEPKRAPTYRRLIARQSISNGIAADDGVALHYIDRTLARVVSMRPAAFAYHVKHVAGKAAEEQIKPQYLG